MIKPGLYYSTHKNMLFPIFADDVHEDTKTVNVLLPGDSYTKEVAFADFEAALKGDHPQYRLVTPIWSGEMMTPADIASAIWSDTTGAEIPQTSVAGSAQDGGAALLNKMLNIVE